MTVAATIRVVEPGDTALRGATWAAKEEIHRVDGELRQDRRFFDAQYRRCRDYLVVTADGADVLAFAVVRRDGYLSLLGVAPGYRRQGLASRLVDRALADHDRLTCHVSATNEGAIAFYTDHGFTVEANRPRYYEDGTDAYELALEAGGGEARDRLTETLR